MKVQKENPKNKLYLKSCLIAVAIVLIAVCCKAQETLAFPFQGGSSVMTRFFRDSLIVTPDIIQKRATGVAIFKFTADLDGKITKIIIYYADDYILTKPIIEALKKSNRKWIIPDHVKTHDFIIPFSIYFNPPANPGTVADDAYKFYSQRRPILSLNQIPLDDATLLPTVVVTYDVQ